jgi:hypothetical protein
LVEPFLTGKEVPFKAITSVDIPKGLQESSRIVSISRTEENEKCIILRMKNRKKA